MLFHINRIESTYRFLCAAPNKLLNGIYRNAHEQPQMKHFLLYMCCQTEVKPTSVRTWRLALYCSQGIVAHAGVRGGRDCCYTNTRAGTITFQVVLSLEVSVNLLQMLLFVQFKEHPVQTYNTKTIISTSAHFCLCYSSTRLPWGIWPWTWRVSGNVFVKLY